MIKNPLLEEIYKIREDISKEFDYDSKRLFRHYQERQEQAKAAGKKYVSLPPKRPKKEAA